ncbi:MAG: hypothetical protein V4603_04080 [Pseudomonadota bacterium]
MNIKAIAAVVAVTLFTVGFAPVSSAQESPLPAGVEVITITAKRPDPTVASNCINEVITTARANAADGRSNSKATVRQAIRHCMEQSATGEAQI